MSKQSGVVAVHPHGDTSRCQVFATGDAKLTEEAVKKAFEGKKFEVKKFTTTNLTAKKDANSN